MFLVEGEILSQIDLNEEAYTLYSQYLENQPDDIEILYARALIAERLDRVDQAERDFLKVLAIDPENTRALNALGYTLADRTDRYQEALVYVQQALAQTPDDPAVIDSMGWVMYRLGRLSEARDYLQKAYDMTKDSEIAAHLGEVLWVMGEQAQAKALWESARKATPDDAVLKETVRRYLP
jgi:tetratricopeptide (TPR) repeat protein